MSRSNSRTRISSAGSRTSLKDSRDKKKEAKESDESPGETEVAQLAWRVLSEANTKELSTMDVADVASTLSSLLSLSHCEEKMEEAALLDYYVAAYWFAREENFTDEQTSTLFTIMHTLMGNLQDRHISLSDNVEELQKLLMGVGVSHRTAVRCLTPEVAVLVVRYVTTTLFQHYRLFQCLLEEEQEEGETLHMPLSVELSPKPASLVPPPLTEAVPLHLFQEYMVPQPEDQEEATQQEEEVFAELINIPQEDSEALMKVSPEELKTLMERLTLETLHPYREEVMEAMTKKEQALMGRLSNIQKSLT